MSIIGLSINTRNIDASVRFYTEVVHARVVERSPHHAELDVDGGRLSLRAVGDDAPASKWEPADQQRGFRHMGFKVASVDETVARAEALALDPQVRAVVAVGYHAADPVTQAALGDLPGQRVHALAIKARAPGEA